MMITSTHFAVLMPWLARTSLQAAVLVILVLTAQAALRGVVSPPWRHALWFLLAARLVLPWAPQSDFSVFNLQRLIPAIEVEAHGDEASRKQAVPLPGDPKTQPGGARSAFDGNLGNASRVTAVPTHHSVHWVSVLGVAWLAGLACFLGNAFLASFRLSGRVRPQ